MAKSSLGRQMASVIWTIHSQTKLKKHGWINNFFDGNNSMPAEYVHISTKQLENVSFIDDGVNARAAGSKTDVSVLPLKL